MPAREAVKVVADAMAANLPTKLSALTVVSGESAPTIADFRDTFSDDIPENPRDWPMVATLLEDDPADGEFETFGKGDIAVPLAVAFVTFDRDLRTAWSKASYAYRGIWQVLNDIAQPTTNNVQLVQLTTPRVSWMQAQEKPGVLVMFRFQAFMRDLSP